MIFFGLKKSWLMEPSALHMPAGLNCCRMLDAQAIFSAKMASEEGPGPTSAVAIFEINQGKLSKVKQMPSWSTAV